MLKKSSRKLLIIDPYTSSGSNEPLSASLFLIKRNISKISFIISYLPLILSYIEWKKKATFFGILTLTLFHKIYRKILLIIILDCCSFLIFDYLYFWSLAFKEILGKENFLGPSPVIGVTDLWPLECERLFMF